MLIIAIIKAYKQKSQPIFRYDYLVYVLLITIPALLDLSLQSTLMGGMIISILILIANTIEMFFMYYKCPMIIKCW